VPLSTAFTELGFGANGFKSFRKSLQFRVREIFNVDHFLVGMPDGTDNLIELQVNGASVAILCVLNEEDHQESDDRSGRVHDELPGVRIMKVWATRAPQNDHKRSKREDPFRADGL